MTPRREALARAHAILACGFLQSSVCAVATTDEEEAEDDDVSPAAGAARASVAAPAATITDKVFLDVKFQGVNPAADKSGRDSNLDAQAAGEGRIVIGLYGKDSPEAAALFRDLFAGTLAAVCKVPPQQLPCDK